MPTNGVRSSTADHRVRDDHAFEREHHPSKRSGVWLSIMVRTTLRCLPRSMTSVVVRRVDPVRRVAGRERVGLLRVDPRREPLEIDEAGEPPDARRIAPAVVRRAAVGGEARGERRARAEAVRLAQLDRRDVRVRNVHVRRVAPARSSCAQQSERGRRRGAADGAHAGEHAGEYPRAAEKVHRAGLRAPREKHGPMDWPRIPLEDDPSDLLRKALRGQPARAGRARAPRGAGRARRRGVARGRRRAQRGPGARGRRRAAARSRQVRRRGGQALVSRRRGAARRAPPPARPASLERLSVLLAGRQDGGADRSRRLPEDAARRGERRPVRAALHPDHAQARRPLRRDRRRRARVSGRARS